MFHVHSPVCPAPDFIFWSRLQRKWNQVPTRHIAETERPVGLLQHGYIWSQSNPSVADCSAWKNGTSDVSTVTIILKTKTHFHFWLVLYSGYNGTSIETVPNRPPIYLIAMRKSTKFVDLQCRMRQTRLLLWCYTFGPNARRRVCSGACTTCNIYFSTGYWHFQASDRRVRSIWQTTAKPNTTNYIQSTHILPTTLPLGLHRPPSRKRFATYRMPAATISFSCLVPTY